MASGWGVSHVVQILAISLDLARVDPGFYFFALAFGPPLFAWQSLRRRCDHGSPPPLCLPAYPNPDNARLLPDRATIRLNEVYRDFESLRVKPAKSALRPAITLFGSEAVPSYGFGVILGNSSALLIQGG